MNGTAFPGEHKLDVVVQRQEKSAERMRAVMLLWIDEFERMLGLSPRTAEIRKWWREQGEPEIGD